MRRILMAGLVLPLLAAPAFSQSTTPPPASQPGTAMPAAPRTGQTMPTTTTPTTATGLAPGANSFTENQARTRLMEHGYTAVSELKRDKDGVWRGMATKDAKSVAVGVDYKGDISGG